MTRTILVAAFLVVACRGNDSSPTDAPGMMMIDAPGSGSNMGSGSADTCTSYTTMTIAAMRQQTHPGCYELDNVVTTALSASTTNPRLFVEDAAGGAFSAIMAECESHSTTHPCSVVTTVTGLAIGHKVTVKGTYIKTASTTFEEFFIDSVTDGGATTAIPAATATLADIERGGTNTGLRFQYVSVTLTGPLVMYDFSPAEFADATATSCPYETGFGMIPMSSGTATTMACTNNTTQPTGVTTPNAAEVLFATDFYKTFEVETDCKCAKTPSVEPATSSMVTGNLKGMLLFDSPFGATSAAQGYYYLDPTTAADVTITGTTAPVM